MIIIHSVIFVRANIANKTYYNSCLLSLETIKLDVLKCWLWLKSIVESLDLSHSSKSVSEVKTSEIHPINKCYTLPVFLFWPSLLPLSVCLEVLGPPLFSLPVCAIAFRLPAPRPCGLEPEFYPVGLITPDYRRRNATAGRPRTELVNSSRTLQTRPTCCRDKLPRERSSCE